MASVAVPRNGLVFADSMELADQLVLLMKDHPASEGDGSLLTRLREGVKRAEVCRVWQWILCPCLITCMCRQCGGRTTGRRTLPTCSRSRRVVSSNKKESSNSLGCMRTT